MTITKQEFFVASPSSSIYTVNIEWDDDEDDDFSYEDAVSAFLDNDDDMDFSINDCSWGVREGFLDKLDETDVSDISKFKYKVWIHDTEGWVYLINLVWDTGDMSDALDEYIENDGEIEGNSDQCSWGVFEDYKQLRDISIVMED